MEENNVQVQIVTLRKLLVHAAIASVPGRGYRFTLQVEVDGASEVHGPLALRRPLSGELDEPWCACPMPRSQATAAGAAAEAGQVFAHAFGDA